jgi:hypothetical protein
LPVALFVRGVAETIGWLLARIAGWKHAFGSWPCYR